MARAGRQAHRVRPAIRRLDADEVAPRVSADVGHPPRLFGPGIPHDRCLRAALCDTDPPPEDRIVHGARRRRVEEHPIGLAGERQRLGAGDRVFQTVDLVDEPGALEPVNADRLDVADRQVRVQRDLVRDLVISRVLDVGRHGE